MGKGDKRTRKGKISRGSFGKSRPRKKLTAAKKLAAAKAKKGSEKKAADTKKTPAKKK
jgi:30S ribosomal protein S31